VWSERATAVAVCVDARRSVLGPSGDAEAILLGLRLHPRPRSHRIMFSGFRHAVESLATQPRRPDSVDETRPEGAASPDDHTSAASGSPVASSNSWPGSALAGASIPGIANIGKLQFAARSASPARSAAGAIRVGSPALSDRDSQTGTPRQRLTLEDRLKARFAIGDASPGDTPEPSARNSPLPAANPLSPASTPLPDSPAVSPIDEAPVLPSLHSHIQTPSSASRYDEDVAKAVTPGHEGTDSAGSPIIDTESTAGLEDISAKTDIPDKELALPSESTPEDHADQERSPQPSPASDHLDSTKTMGVTTSEAQDPTIEATDDAEVEAATSKEGSLELPQSSPSNPGSNDNVQTSSADSAAASNDLGTKEQTDTPPSLSPLPPNGPDSIAEPAPPQITSQVVDSSDGVPEQPISSDKSTDAATENGDVQAPSLSATPSPLPAAEPGMDVEALRERLKLIEQRFAG
jgi:hypothetical protein